MSPCEPDVLYIAVNCAYKKAPCPHCGKRGKLIRTHNRPVRTIAYTVADGELTNRIIPRQECFGIRRIIHKGKGITDEANRIDVGTTEGNRTATQSNP